MNSHPPFQQRLEQLLNDVAKDRLILDFAGRADSNGLSELSNVRKVHLPTHKKRGRSPFAGLPSEQLGMILIRSAWPQAVQQGLLAQVNAKVDSETPLVVIEEVADSFRDYQGLAPYLQMTTLNYGRPLVYSDEIENQLRQSGFTPQTIEPFQLDKRYDTQSLLIKVRGQPRNPELISKLPDFVLASIGIQRKRGAIIYRHGWSISVSFKSDVARHPVNAVASVLLTRRVGKETCLLLQRRHRERLFWEHWELPQGHIIPGETFEEAASRELFEETQLTANLRPEQPFIKPWKQEATYAAACVYTRINQTPKKEFFAVGVIFDYVSGEPRSPEDRQFTWTPIAKLKELLKAKLIFPLNEDMIRRFVEMQV